MTPKKAKKLLVIAPAERATRNDGSQRSIEANICAAAPPILV
jgi:hypothetical protein